MLTANEKKKRREKIATENDILARDKKLHQHTETSASSAISTDNRYSALKNNIKEKYDNSISDNKTAGVSVSRYCKYHWRQKVAEDTTGLYVPYDN